MEFSSKHERQIQQAHDYATHALDAHATTNGKVMALELRVKELEKLLEMRDIFGSKPDADTHERITKLETRATKHLGHLRAHRARLDAMDGTRRPAPTPARTVTGTSSAPAKFRVPTSTLAKAAARPVVQTTPVLTAHDLLAKADANLTGSAFGITENLIRRGKLKDAHEFMENHAKEKRETSLLRRAEWVQGITSDQRNQLIRGIKDGHHGPAEKLLDELEARPGSGVRKGPK
jgi:hypothetical protein